MLAADAVSRKRGRGVSAPRIAPPEPAHTRLAELETAARDLRIELLPWQRIAARYITAIEPRTVGRPRKNAVRHWRYSEVCVVVARQNGKTELLLPRILMGLRNGESILHTAQNRRLPRKTFLKVAGVIAAHPDLPYDIRKANGQEEITAPGGGRYVLVAPNESSRGESADLVLIDEVREQHDQDLMDAMLPTTIARPNAQVIYLSNAGDDDSIVLNELRRRGTQGDDSLAYLEWSARPDRDIDDRDGWAEANPGLGRTIGWEALEQRRTSRPAASFETEHLCRWVAMMRTALLDAELWEIAHGTPERAVRPTLGIGYDPSGSRASAVIAWQSPRGYHVEDVAEAKGSPIPLEDFAPQLVAKARSLGVARVVGDPYSEPLLRYFPSAARLTAREFAFASTEFVRLLEGHRLHWQGEDDPIGEDLPWATRHVVGPNSWSAVPIRSEQPITALLAAIRAVGAVLGPFSQPVRVR